MTRTRKAAAGVTVHWAIVGGTAIPGTDYTGPTEGDIPFAAGETSRTIAIPLVNTPAADGSRTIVVEILKTAAGSASPRSVAPSPGHS